MDKANYINKLVELTSKQKLALKTEGIKSLGLYIVRSVCKNCGARGHTVFDWQEKATFENAYCGRCGCEGFVEIEEY